MQIFWRCYGLMPIDGQKKILTIGSTFRFHSHRIINFILYKTNMFKDLYGRDADKILYRGIDQISAKFTTTDATESAIQNDITIHPECRYRYRNFLAYGLKFVDNGSPCINQEIGHDRGIVTRQINAIRHDSELGRTR